MSDEFEIDKYIRNDEEGNPTADELRARVLKYALNKLDPPKRELNDEEVQAIMEMISSD